MTEPMVSLGRSCLREAFHPSPYRELPISRVLHWPSSFSKGSSGSFSVLFCSRDREVEMFGRAVLAFLALPGVVAYLVPLLLAPTDTAGTAWRWSGRVLIVVGSTLLLWCVRDFYVAGKGTLAPWSPPQRLVTSGLYRWTRNPMYVSVLVVVMGWVVLYRSPIIAMYLVGLAVVFQLRVILHEERWLKKAFGEDWARYRNRVGRWTPWGRNQAP